VKIPSVVPTARRPLVEKLVDSLSAVPGVQAVVLGGLFARPASSSAFSPIRWGRWSLPCCTPAALPLPASPSFLLAILTGCPPCWLTPAKPPPNLPTVFLPLNHSGALSSQFPEMNTGRATRFNYTTLTFLSWYGTILI